MNDEILVEDNALEVQEEVTEVEEVEEESIEDIRARLQKAEQLAENQKIRAEKAERKAKEVVKTEAPSSLTTKDMYALMTAKVAEEDISDVEEYATLKGISVSEALKTGVVKSILAQKEEERRVAAGTNTGTTRRGTSKVTDDQLVDRARKGDAPDSVEDIQRLNKLRWGLK